MWLDELGNVGVLVAVAVADGVAVLVGVSVAVLVGVTVAEPVLVGGLAMGKYLVPGAPLAGEHTPAELKQIASTLK